MKTHISEFCTEFSEALMPLSEALSDTVGQLEAIGESSLESMHTAFANDLHRLESLVNKVQGQEAYVLLFGPLKSGKSTLMNAISASYVSEVTSLPAYPCMVNLKYGPEPSYSVIRYSGKKETLASPEDLKTLLEQSHRTLSERVRAIEDFGETFDPDVHLPSAIRRVQVELPAENLRESGTVLVDTPGLYSKMKFGYDAMSREFRDSAASAVFVVKTDNLFLEQVFDDFNDLLDQFSRVFVVVNIDAGKRDLSPDGTLSQSLESSDPGAIVKAFESLTMSAPLRHASESGRLHIYPVDLCSAAARRLANGAGPAPVEVGGGEDDFDEFLKDLLTYLNSTDYLLEFMADTIRQSEKLSKNIAGQCEGQRAEAFDRALASTREQQAQLQRAHEAANLLGNQPWTKRYAELMKHQLNALRKLQNEAREQFRVRTKEEIDAWFDSDESIAQLRERRLAAPTKQLIEKQVKEVEAKLAALGNTPQTGLKLDAEEDAALNLIGIRLEALAENALKVLPKTSVGGSSPLLPLDQIPVRRSLADKLFFRSTGKRRRKLFGEDEDLSAAFPQKNKEKKLGRTAKDELLDRAMETLDAQLDPLRKAQLRKCEEDFPKTLSKLIEKELAEQERTLSRKRKDQTEKANKLNEVQSTFARLSKVVDKVIGEVNQLQEKHGPAIQRMAGAEAPMA
ncbi:MAG: dynamin family protein [Verrucomicrobia bacterium]|nr:dynamin family protein [Verrucomicrobiota bacterium]MCH8512449.1 dynamin family protein [Kiritimatiellia bacterium]